MPTVSFCSVPVPVDELAQGVSAARPLGRAAGPSCLPAASVSRGSGQNFPLRMHLTSPAYSTWWSPVSLCRKQTLEEVPICLISECLSRLQDLAPLYLESQGSGEGRRESALVCDCVLSQSGLPHGAVETLE